MESSHHLSANHSIKLFIFYIESNGNIVSMKKKVYHLNTSGVFTPDELSTIMSKINKFDGEVYHLDGLLCYNNTFHANRPSLIKDVLQEYTGLDTIQISPTADALRCTNCIVMLLRVEQPKQYKTRKNYMSSNDTPSNV